jgi:hypothetical protein
MLIGSWIGEEAILTIFPTTEISLAKIKNSIVRKKQSTVTGLTEMKTDI